MVSADGIRLLPSCKTSPNNRCLGFSEVSAGLVRRGYRLAADFPAVAGRIGLVAASGIVEGRRAKYTNEILFMIIDTIVFQFYAFRNAMTHWLDGRGFA